MQQSNEITETLAQTIERLVRDAYQEGYNAGAHAGANYAEAIADHNNQPAQFRKPGPFSEWEARDWNGSDAEAITATAAQRAEAFLKTLGKWED